MSSPIAVSVHIPKCAGTSFGRILQNIHGSGYWPNYGRIMNRWAAVPGIVPEGTTCIHGHFDADAFDDLFPDRLLVTWVRHPVERVVSLYQHFLRAPDPENPLCRALFEGHLSLRRFADLPYARNEMVRWLAWKPVAAFFFVGIAERFGESLREFFARLGRPEKSSEQRENTNPGAERGYSVHWEDFAYIAERNAADMEWYGEACVRAGFTSPAVHSG